VVYSFARKQLKTAIVGFKDSEVQLNVDLGGFKQEAAGIPISCHSTLNTAEEALRWKRA